MNPLKIILYAAVLIVALTGCTKNEVTLNFELPSDVNMPCRIVYYASGKNAGMLRETVAEIAAGKGEIKLPQQYPGIIYLFSSGAKNPEALIYAKKGDEIIITGENSSISRWEIKGNKTTEALSRFRLENEDAIKSGDTEKLNRIVAQYIKENPSSAAAAIILYNYFRRQEHEKEFYSLQNSLDKSIMEDEKLRNALSAADLISNMPDKYSYPQRIVLHGDGGYADTLSLSKGKVSFIMFRGGKDSGNVLPLDSLNKLIERSKSLRMAEIYMDLDSLAWSRHVKADTVKNMKRLWMPLGTLDSVAISMGIRRIPYYVVLDSIRNEAYRGDDWKEALKKVKTLIK